MSRTSTEWRDDAMAMVMNNQSSQGTSLRVVILPSLLLIDCVDICVFSTPPNKRQKAGHQYGLHKRRGLWVRGGVG